MKRRMEVIQHCWKFIYKHSDIEYLLYVTYFIFYNFFYLHRCRKNIFTNKFSNSGYPHDGCADKNPYPHDRRADKDSYPHDSNNYNQCIILRLQLSFVMINVQFMLV